MTAQSASNASTAAIEAISIRQPLLYRVGV
jgi:hypothetical protein